MSVTTPTEDMKTFSINKFVSGLETEVELRYICQQAVKCLGQPKYQQGANEGLGVVNPSWKDRLKPWFVENSRAAKFLQKETAATVNDFFDMLILRNRPKVKDYNVEFLDLILELVVPRSGDDHQVSIETYLESFVDRRLHNILQDIVTPSINLAVIPALAGDTQAKVAVREAVLVAVSEQINAALPALKREVKKVLGSEIAMSMIGCDPTLFASWTEGKPIDASLHQLIEFVQTNHLDQGDKQPEKLICLRYNSKGKSPIITVAELERSAKRKAENVPSDRLVASKSGGKSTPHSTTSTTTTTTTTTSSTGTTPNVPKVGHPVAVPCKLCLASGDAKKKEKAAFHLYEKCFDHPTFGPTLKANFFKSNPKSKSKK